MILDVAGGLFVPRLTADMINIGVENGDLNYMLAKGAVMLAVTLIAGAGALACSWFCAATCEMRSMKNRWNYQTMILSSSGPDP